MSKFLFNELRKINVNDHTEQVKQGNATLTYLSWSWAVDEVSKNHEFSYQIKWFDDKPYLRDERLGYMVFTEVTVDGVTKEMWLPVMDSHNKAMKDEPYQVKTKYSTFTVQACTMFDINKAIMRCLTKNLAMFGLGLYIYAGEDLPESEIEVANETQKKTTRKQTTKKDNSTELLKEIQAVYLKYPNSSTLTNYLTAVLKQNKVQKISELNEAELKNIKEFIDMSMKKIESEDE